MSARDTKKAVRDRYASAARDFLEPGLETSCCGPDGCLADATKGAGFGAVLYKALAAEDLPDTATLTSLGCGDPTAFAQLKEGDVVLDLGSGAGLDVLLSAKRVGDSGKVYGLDMTDEMLVLAARNTAEVGAHNVEFVKGDIEDIPLPDGSIDVIISNCVINLSPDKPQVFREAHRVLRPGGRFAVSDVVTTRPFTSEEQADLARWSGCISGALTRDEYLHGLESAGFSDVDVEEAHGLSDGVISAVVRATA